MKSNKESFEIQTDEVIVATVTQKEEPNDSNLMRILDTQEIW